MRPLVTPSPRQAEELKKLRFNAEIMDYLDACVETAKDRLVACPSSEEFRVAQGQALVYVALHKLIAEDEPLPKAVPGRR